MKSRNVPNPVEMLMQIQDQAANAVASLTGVKNQFIKAGWTPEAAEKATIELLRQGTNNEANK